MKEKLKILKSPLICAFISYVLSMLCLYIIYRIPNFLSGNMLGMSFVFICFFAPLFTLPLSTVLVALFNKSSSRFLRLGIYELVMLVFLDPVIRDHVVIYRNELAHWGYEIIIGLKMFICMGIITGGVIYFIIKQLKLTNEERKNSVKLYFLEIREDARNFYKNYFNVKTLLKILCAVLILVMTSLILSLFVNTSDILITYKDDDIEYTLSKRGRIVVYSTSDGVCIGSRDITEDETNELKKLIQDRYIDVLISSIKNDSEMSTYAIEYWKGNVHHNSKSLSLNYDNSDANQKLLDYILKLENKYIDRYYR